MSPWLVHLIDAVMLLTVAEFLVLRSLYQRTARGVAPHDMGLNLFSGLCLMLALRAALSDWGLLPILAFLLAAGVLHGLDIRRRWRR